MKSSRLSLPLLCALARLGPCWEDCWYFLESGTSPLSCVVPLIRFNGLDWPIVSGCSSFRVRTLILPPRSSAHCFGVAASGAHSRWPPLLIAMSVGVPRGVDGGCGLCRRLLALLGLPVPAMANSVPSASGGCGVRSAPTTIGWGGGALL